MSFIDDLNGRFKSIAIVPSEDEQKITDYMTTQIKAIPSMALYEMKVIVKAVQGEDCFKGYRDLYLIVLEAAIKERENPVICTSVAMIHDTYCALIPLCKEMYRHKTGSGASKTLCFEQLTNTELFHYHYYVSCEKMGWSCHGGTPSTMDRDHTISLILRAEDTINISCGSCRTYGRQIKSGVIHCANCRQMFCTRDRCVKRVNTTACIHCDDNWKFD